MATSLPRTMTQSDSRLLCRCPSGRGRGRPHSRKAHQDIPGTSKVRGMLNIYLRFKSHAVTTQAPLHYFFAGPRVKGLHPINWTSALSTAFDGCKSLSRCHIDTPRILSTTRLGYRRLNHRRGCHAATKCDEGMATSRFFLQKLSPA